MVVVQDGYLSYFQDQEEAEVYRAKDGDSEFHHHPSSQRQLSLDCVEAVRTEVREGRPCVQFFVVAPTIYISGWPMKVSFANEVKNTSRLCCSSRRSLEVKWSMGRREEKKPHVS